MDLFYLISEARSLTKFGMLAKDDITTVVVNVNVVQGYNGRFYAILSDGLLGSEVIGVDITYSIDSFNEAIKAIGYKWSSVYSGMEPRMIPLTVLRGEQDFANDNEEYVNRLLLVKT